MSSSTPVELPTWDTPDDIPWNESAGSSNRPVRPSEARAAPDAKHYRKYFGLPDAETYDYDQPASMACHEDAVFVTIDFEAKEINPNQGLVFEAGITSLDSRDTVGKPPGDRGIDWIMKCVKCKHFKIIERPFRNSKYVKGNPDGFLFGQSQWCSLENFAKDIQEYVDGLLTEPNVSGVKPMTPTRHLVLIAHACTGDEKYADQIGLKWPLADNAQIVDTQPLACGVILNAQMPGPAVYKMLNAVGLLYSDKDQTGTERNVHVRVDPNHLHNSGNDAAFELQGLIAMIVMTTDQYKACHQMTMGDNDQTYQAGLPFLPKTWGTRFTQPPNPLQPSSNRGVTVAHSNTRPTNTKPMPQTKKNGVLHGFTSQASSSTAPANATYTTTVQMSQKDRKKANRTKKDEPKI